MKLEKNKDYLCDWPRGPRRVQYLCRAHKGHVRVADPTGTGQAVKTVHRDQLRPLESGVKA